MRLRQTWIAALGSLTALFVILSACSAARAQPLADRVPEDAIIYIGWAGAGNMPEAYAQSHLKAVLDNSRIRQLFTEFLPAARQKLVEHEPEAEEPTRIIMALAKPMWRYPTAIFAGVDLSNPDQPMPKVGIICRAGADSGALHKQVMDLLAQAGEIPLPIRSFERDDLVALVIGYDDDQNPLADAAGKAALADAPAFTAALKHVQSDPRIIFYLDAEKLIAEVEQAVQKIDDEQAKQMVPKVLDASGLRGLKRVISTSGFDGADWMSMSFIEAPAPRSGLLSVLDAKPVSPELLNAVPPDATFVATARFDAARFIQEVRKAAAEVDPRASQFIDMGLAGVQKALAKNPMDILEPLGEDWVIYCSPSVSGNGLLGMVVVNRLDDPAKAKTTFPAATIDFSNWIATALSKANAEVEIRARTTKIGEHTIYYMGLPIVAPSWTQHGDYLYLSLFPQSAAAGARAGAREDKSFAENEKYHALMKRLNVENPVSVSFYDLPTVVSHGSMYQQWMLLLRYAGFGDLFGIPIPEPLMPPMDVLLQHLSPAGSATWIDDAGIHTKEISPFPGAKLLSEPGMFVSGGGPAGAALGVSILLPSLNRARETANRVKCASNMRMIGQAILLYSNDNRGQYPPDLGSLIKTQDITAEAFICPSGDTSLPPLMNMTPDQMAEWVNQHSDYVYLGAGKRNDLGAEDIVLYEKPNDHDFDGINMLYGDGHVQFNALPYSIQQLERQGVQLDVPERHRRRR